MLAYPYSLFLGIQITSEMIVYQAFTPLCIITAKFSIENNLRIKRGVYMCVL